MKEFDIVCIGNICLDVRMVIPTFLVRNTKTRVKDYDLSCGGPAAVAAAVGAKFGFKTGFVGAVTDDPFGEIVTKQLNEYGVNTEYITVNKNRNIKTAYASVLVCEDDASRTIVSNHNSELKVVNLQKFSTKVLEFDGQEPGASFKAMEMNPNAITILDAGRVKEATIELGKKVDYLVCSKDFAEDFVEEEMIKERIETIGKKSPKMAKLYEREIKLMKKMGIKFFLLNNPTSIIKAYEIMSRTFPGNILITLEDKGCVYKDNEEIKLAPALNLKRLGLKVKDTTGAGDIFHGAFSCAMTKDGMSIEDAVRFSNIVAGLSVTEIGGIASIPTPENVQKMLQTAEKQKIIILNPKKNVYVKQAA